MTYDPPVQPYAPPKAPYEPPPPQGIPAAGPPLPLDVGSMLSGAWNVFTRHWAPLCVGMLIVGLVVAVPFIVVYIGGMAVMIGASEAARAGGDPEAGAMIGIVFAGIMVAAMMLMFLVSPIFTARLMRMSMTAVRGGTPAVGDLFKGEMRYGSMLGLMFLQTFAIFLGYLLFIVPGVILAIGLHFSVFLVVDRRMGAVEAMKASWALTRGKKGEVFVVMMLFGLVASGCGLIPFVGHFIGYSLMMLGLSIAYMRLMGEAAPVLPPPPMPYYAPQPGYPAGPYGVQPPPPYGPPPQGPYGGGYGGGGYGGYPPPGAPR